MIKPLRYSAGPLDEVLTRLEKVRQTGPAAWKALCPAHEDRNPSLSVAEAPNGMVLLHCWAGCPLDAVVQAIGLRVSDLFPPQAPPLTPQERLAWAQRKRLAGWAAALRVLHNEATVIQIAGGDLASGRVPSGDDQARLREAVTRIAAARDALA